MSPYNKLWTKTAFAKVPALHATEDVPADEKIAHVKIFSVRDDQRWYVLEYDPETGTAFCLHTNRDESELGYSSIPEMQDVNAQRDSSFKPTRVSALPRYAFVRSTTMNEIATDKQARVYADSYINGNRASTCREILERNPGPTSHAACRAAIMASKVAVIICKDKDSGMAEEFIRILESQTE